MSLSVKLIMVYKINNDDNAEPLKKIDCTCHVKFRDTLQIRLLNEDVNNKYSKYLEIDEDDVSLLAKSNKEIEFFLGSEINRDEKLQIECYRNGLFKSKKLIKIL